MPSIRVHVPPSSPALIGQSCSPFHPPTYPKPVTVAAGEAAVTQTDGATLGKHVCSACTTQPGQAQVQGGCYPRQRLAQPRPEAHLLMRTSHHHLQKGTRVRGSQVGSPQGLVQEGNKGQSTRHTAHLLCEVLMALNGLRFSH